VKTKRWLFPSFLILLLAVPAGCGAAPDDGTGGTGDTVVAAAGSTDNAAAPAAAVEQTYFDEFMDKIYKGGTTMVFLLVLSIAGISRIIERGVNLRAPTFATEGLVAKANKLYQDEQYDELGNVCRKDESILGRIVLAVVDHRECDAGDIQSIADDIGSREVRVQMQKAYTLAIIATLSPLLGLFGTVIGMIGAFDTVASVGEMGNASIMAGDIAKALVTTAGGLIVAMPMLGCYHWFRARTNRYAIGLEEDMAELFSAWFLKKKSA
jgi:biopolymer transport protein ExbB